jgi:hypothetical protein
MSFGYPWIYFRNRKIFRGRLSERNIIFYLICFYDALLYKFLDAPVPNFGNRKDLYCFRVCLSKRNFFMYLSFFSYDEPFGLNRWEERADLCCYIWIIYEYSCFIRVWFQNQEYSSHTSPLAGFSKSDILSVILSFETVYRHFIRFTHYKEMISIDNIIDSTVWQYCWYFYWYND